MFLRIQISLKQQWKFHLYNAVVRFKNDFSSWKKVNTYESPNVIYFFCLETFLTGNLPSSARLQFLQHKRKIQHLSFCQKRWFYIIFHNFVLEQQRQHNKASHLTDNASMDTIFHEKVRNNTIELLTQNIEQIWYA